MTIKKLLILILACLLLDVNFVYPQDVLTWKECVRQAKENNPDLISATEKVRQAKADKDVDLSPMLPQVDAELSGERTQTSARDAKKEYKEKPDCAYCVFRKTNDCPYLTELSNIYSKGSKRN